MQSLSGNAEQRMQAQAFYRRTDKLTATQTELPGLHGSANTCGACKELDKADCLLQIRDCWCPEPLWMPS